MRWLRLPERFSSIERLLATGILLCATATALLTTVWSPRWQAPLIAFLGVIGLAIIASPLVQRWYRCEKECDDEQPFSWTIPSVIVLGLLILLAYRASDALTPGNAIVELLLIAGAACVVGVLIGFLFGIPRIATKAGVGDASLDGSAARLETNTNLELISDWLTKIIVGVGLIQSDEIVTRFDTLLDNLEAVGLRKPLVGGTLLFFLVAGFLSGYLWTRLILTRHFSMSEQALRETSEYYEGLMNAYLYQPKPDGFRKVIRLFEQYTRRFGPPRHSRIWVYLACAHGQWYAWERVLSRKEPDSADLHPIVERTLESIRSAKATDAAALPLLQTCTSDEYDDDLRMIAIEQPAVAHELKVGPKPETEAETEPETEPKEESKTEPGEKTIEPQS